MPAPDSTEQATQSRQPRTLSEHGNVQLRMTRRASGNQSRDAVYGDERYRRMDKRGAHHLGWG